MCNIYRFAGLSERGHICDHGSQCTAQGSAMQCNPPAAPKAKTTSCLSVRREQDSTCFRLAILEWHARHRIGATFTCTNRASRTSAHRASPQAPWKAQGRCCTQKLLLSPPSLPPCLLPCPLAPGARAEAHGLRSKALSRPPPWRGGQET